MGLLWSLTRVRRLFQHDTSITPYTFHTPCPTVGPAPGARRGALPSAYCVSWLLFFQDTFVYYSLGSSRQRATPGCRSIVCPVLTWLLLFSHLPRHDDPTADTIRVARRSPCAPRDASPRHGWRRYTPPLTRGHTVNTCRPTPLPPGLSRPPPPSSVIIVSRPLSRPLSLMAVSVGTLPSLLPAPLTH